MMVSPTDLSLASIKVDLSRRPRLPTLRPPLSLRDVGRSRSSSDSCRSRSDSNEGATGCGSFASLFSGRSTASSASSVSDGDCVSPPVGTEFKNFVEESLDCLPRSRPTGPYRFSVDATSPTLSASCSPSLTDLHHPHPSPLVRKSSALSIPNPALSRKFTNLPSSTLFQRRRVMRRAERAFALALSVSPSYGITGHATSPTTPIIDLYALELRSPTHCSRRSRMDADASKGLAITLVSSSDTPQSILSTSVSIPEHFGHARDVRSYPAIRWAPTPPELHHRRSTPARPLVCAAPSPPLVPSPILQLPPLLDQRMYIKRGDSGMLEASPMSIAPGSPLIGTIF